MYEDLKQKAQQRIDDLISEREGLALDHYAIPYNWRHFQRIEAQLCAARQSLSFWSA